MTAHNAVTHARGIRCSCGFEVTWQGPVKKLGSAEIIELARVMREHMIEAARKESG